ncbi:Short transient receptor potential channel 4 [Stylophora pistillata]|uniref:Short transient receptor potential channel 4 n=1 Tax=Stylophora pistillata TaxID=50429 RepID=A0A2B4RL09_STYPI|nr:Short transient receptor potential channel 4 [Stylophora pistillata]
MEEYITWLELQTVSNEEVNDRKAFEDCLRKTIKDGEFDEISDKLTPRALTKCNTNALLMAMEVNFELQRLADKKGPDHEDFDKLAASLDEFISRLFDPLKSGGRLRDVFLRDSIDNVMDAAIEFKQKKFFAHPVINSQMTKKWHGEFGWMRKCSWLSTERWLWVFLNVWCVFDVVLFPIIFIVFGAYHLTRKKTRNREGRYLKYFTIPYFIFVRDTFSFLVHLGLHFGLCLAPSSISISGLEWAICVFYMGRMVTEMKQIRDTKIPQGEESEKPGIKEPLTCGSVEILADPKESSIRKSKSTSLARKFSKYLNDRWNVLDLTTITVYLIIFALRMLTWAVSDSVVNNRALVMTGYLYGLNTMFLTFRAFGLVMEIIRGVGAIQIALFFILSDVAIIFWQFMAAILAFSIAITKVYVAERSYLVKEDRDKNAWWTVAKHLCWSLLGIVELDALDSSDELSVTVVRFLYGGFMIVGAVLLMNMMIALLSNTYQRVERNLVKRSRPIRISRMEEKMLRLKMESLDLVVKNLQIKYFASYGYTFPLSDQGKMEKVFQETRNLRPMTNQVAYSTFITDGYDKCVLPTGPKAWKSEGIRIEHYILMYEGVNVCKTCKDHPTASQKNHGARYLVPFTREFPKFEVLILEAGECRSLEVGVAGKNYESHVNRSRGWTNDCIGYHINGNIFDAFTANSINEIEDAMADRGDVIGCMVMFEMAKNGKVPVVFTLNGKQITQATIATNFEDKESLLFPFVSMGHEGVTVSAKMRPGGGVSRLTMSEMWDRMTSTSSPGTVSTQENEKAAVGHDLEYAETRFRQVRDDMLANLRMNFRRIEDVFSQWNKECMLMNDSVQMGPALRKKIKETLEGFQEVEELGKQLDRKFGQFLKT